MLNVALTGGIGSGKSTICRIFQVLGVPVFHADAEAKKVYVDPLVISRVQQEFGPEVFKDNKLDTKALAAIVFSDPEALLRLNAIVHPPLLEAYEKWRFNYASSPYVIMESAIVFEAGLVQRFDRVITVFADKETCIGRIMNRDGVSEGEVLKRMQSQLDPELKVKKADFVVYNDGRQLVIPQVLAVHRQLTEQL